MREKRDAVILRTSGEAPPRSVGKVVALLGAIALVVGAVIFAGVRLNANLSPAQSMVQAKQFLSDGDSQAAVVTLRGLLQQSPGDPEAHFLLAQTLLQTGDGPGTLRELREARSAGYQGSTALLEAEALLLSGQAAKALGRLAFIDSEQHPGETERLRGQAQLALGRVQAANTSFGKLAKLNTGDSAARRGLAKSALVQGKLEATEQHLSALLASSPEDPQGWLLKGETALHRNDVSGARTAFERALKFDPHNPGAQIGLIQVLLRQRDAPGARRIAEGLVKDAPKFALARYWLGATAQAMDDRETAKAQFLAALSGMPKHPYTLFGLGSIYYQEKNYTEAQAVAQQLTEVAPRFILGLRLLGGIQLRSNQAGNAINTFHEALKVEPEDPQTLAMLGNAYLRINDTEQGMAYLEKAAALAPTNAGILTNLGMVTLRKGNTKQAISHLRNAIAAKQDFLSADMLLAFAQQREGKREEALATMRAFLARNPDDLHALAIQGVMLLRANKLDEARAAFGRLITLAPDSAAGYLNLGRVERALGNPDAAAPHFEALLGRHSEHPSALTGLAELAFEQGRVEDAFALLQRAAKANPRDIESRLVLSRLSRQARRDPQGALTFATAARALSPNNLSVLLTLGQAQLAAGEFESSLATLEKVAKGRPNSAQARVWLAQAQLGTSNAKGAMASLEHAIKLQPQLAGARRMMATLLRDAGKLDAALGQAKQLQGARPKSPAGYQLEGELLEGQRRYRGALKAYARAARLGPGFGPVAGRARTHSALGKPAVVQSELQAYVDQHPKHQRARQMLAEVLHQNGATAPAIRAYDALLSTNPRNVQALNNLAWLKATTDRAAALRLAERAYDVTRERDASVLDTYGWMLKLNGRLEESLAVLERAVAGAPDVGEHAFHLASALAEQGETLRAQGLLKDALRNNPGFPGAQAAKTLLARLEK
ncbi:MAG: putative PEP-CTERM system TPR-repeat lipoprotein [Gammaproteobacteria bacterium]|jgi:putative PEP-CTERM system TPR-repeat lipoprotein